MVNLCRYVAVTVTVSDCGGPGIAVRDFGGSTRCDTAALLTSELGFSYESVVLEWRL